MIASAHVNLKHGEGSGKELPVFLQEKKYQRLGIIVDAALVRNPYFQEVYQFLEKNFEIVKKIINEASDPTYEYLDATVEELRRSSAVDCLIAIGGGSTLDLAKGVSVLLTNSGPGIQYKGVDKVPIAGIPLIMAPTTAGTGSEVTPNASFTDTKEKKKQGISTHFYHPELVVLDPALVASCPESVSVGAGMDALVHHAIDAYISGGADNPLCALFSRTAVSLLFNALPKVVQNPQDLKARSDTQLGALYAGLALTNGGGGSIAGAASYPLGIHFKIPHGTGVAILALEAMRFNIERGFLGYEAFNDAPRYNGDAGADFFQSFSGLCRQMNMPHLSDFGVKETDLRALGEEINNMPVAHKNPIHIDKDDIIAMLKASL